MGLWARHSYCLHAIDTPRCVVGVRCRYWFITNDTQLFGAVQHQPRHGGGRPNARTRGGVAEQAKKRQRRAEDERDMMSQQATTTRLCLHTLCFYAVVYDFQNENTVSVGKYSWPRTWLTAFL